MPWGAGGVRTGDYGLGYARGHSWGDIRDFGSRFPTWSFGLNPDVRLVCRAGALMFRGLIILWS